MHVILSATTRNITVYNEKLPPVTIPPWVVDLASFRRWARSNDFPQHGNIAWLAGDLLVDLSMERVAHNKVKGIISAVLTLLVEGSLGHFFADKMRLTHVAADLSSEPDAMFVSNQSLDEGRVLIEEGEDALEVEGSPDMVLEIISPASVEKDTETLPELYWRAGIEEYWLVEVPTGGLDFTLFRRGPRGYVAARRKDGWLKSVVFGKSFRLTRENDSHDLPHFRLESR